MLRITSRKKRRKKNLLAWQLMLWWMRWTAFHKHRKDTPWRLNSHTSGSRLEKKTIHELCVRCCIEEQEHNNIVEPLHFATWQTLPKEAENKPMHPKMYNTNIIFKNKEEEEYTDEKHDVWLGRTDVHATIPCVVWATPYDGHHLVKYACTLIK